MKISANEKSSRDYIQKLNNTHRNLIAKKETEIKNLNKVFNQKISDTKLEGERNIANQEDKNRADLAKGIKNKEDKLEQVQTDLKNHVKVLNKEKLRLSEVYQDQIENSNNVYQEKFNSLYSNNKQKSDKIIEQTNDQISKLKIQSDSDILKMNTDSQLRADSISRSHDKRISNIDRQNAKLIERQVNQNRDAFNMLQKNHNERVQRHTKKQEMDYNQKVTAQQQELTNVENHHREILKQKRISFKEKFANLENSHRSILDRIKRKFDNEIKGIVEKYSELKNQTLNKTQDDFYHVAELEPIVKQDPTHYMISLQVPEHEHELVNLTAQKRDVHISLTRKFRDQVKNQQGETSKTRRSEVLTKNFVVADILDSKQVDRSYTDGLLTFKIAKL